MTWALGIIAWLALGCVAARTIGAIIPKLTPAEQADEDDRQSVFNSEWVFDHHHNGDMY